MGNNGTPMTRIFHGFRQQAVIVAVAIMGAAVYLAWATATGAWGLALDDAWIHQTYARNLATTGQFAFVPGQPSAGSTSPLWTLLIAPGYLAHVDFKWWTYALGAACLAATALGVRRLSLRWFPDRPRAALAAGILTALEWHLLWAAVSGMETVLFTALAVWLMALALDPTPGVRRPVTVGVLGGLLVLTRPEGLLLVGLILAAQAGQGSKSSDWLDFGWSLAALAALLAPWLAFNWRVSGTLFPNTFYAKQLEYASLLQAIPLTRRLAQVFFAPLIGAQALLIPGLTVAAWALVRRISDRKTWLQLAPLAWIVAHLGLYGLRLPVTYQHGRYEMPVIPALIALGVGGTAALLRWDDARLWPRVLSRAATLAIAVAQLAFVALGARAYATDVMIIEGEMVQVARWLEVNAAPGDLVAAHDIGAIGYFSRQPILDLAGLVSPEVIPFVRDEARLEALIRQRGAVYLVTFPSWYPRMTGQPQMTPTFAGSAQASPEHLTVYRLR
jgi:hypothetical protein